MNFSFEGASYLTDKEVFNAGLFSSSANSNFK